MTEMKAGDILLFKPKANPWDKVIAWGTKSDYCHVAICVSPDMNLAIEAMAGKGVRARDIRRIKADYDVYRVKQSYTYNLNSVISFLVSKLNLRYDYIGVTCLGALKLLSKCNKYFKTLSNKFQKKNDFFCSELIYEAFDRGGGLDIVPDVEEAGITSPADIANSRLIERVKVYR